MIDVVKKDSFEDESRVEFYSNHTSFYVIMKKMVVDNIQDERLNELLDKNEKLIIEYLNKNERITSKIATELTGLSAAHVRRIFK